MGCNVVSRSRVSSSSTVPEGSSTTIGASSRRAEVGTGEDKGEDEGDGEGIVVTLSLPVLVLFLPGELKGLDLPGEAIVLSIPGELKGLANGELGGKLPSSVTDLHGESSLSLNGEDLLSRILAMTGELSGSWI